MLPAGCLPNGSALAMLAPPFGGVRWIAHHIVEPLPDPPLCMDGNEDGAIDVNDMSYYMSLASGARDAVAPPASPAAPPPVPSAAAPPVSPVASPPVVRSFRLERTRELWALPYDYVVIGCGAAGASAAFTLAEVEPESRIVCIEGGREYTESTEVSSDVGLYHVSHVLGGGTTYNWLYWRGIPRRYLRRVMNLSDEQVALFQEEAHYLSNKMTQPLCRSAPRSPCSAEPLRSAARALNMSVPEDAADLMDDEGGVAWRLAKEPTDLVTTRDVAGILSYRPVAQHEDLRLNQFGARRRSLPNRGRASAVTLLNSTRSRNLHVALDAYVDRIQFDSSGVAVSLSIVQGAKRRQPFQFTLALSNGSRGCTRREGDELASYEEAGGATTRRTVAYADDLVMGAVTERAHPGRVVCRNTTAKVVVAGNVYEDVKLLQRSGAAGVGAAGATRAAVGENYWNLFYANRVTRDSNIFRFPRYRHLDVTGTLRASVHGEMSALRFEPNAGDVECSGERMPRGQVSDDGTRHGFHIADGFHRNETEWALVYLHCAQLYFYGVVWPLNAGKEWREVVRDFVGGPADGAGQIASSADPPATHRPYGAFDWASDANASSTLRRIYREQAQVGRGDIDSIHYGGTLSYGSVTDRSFRLAGSDNVYVADLSVLPDPVPGNTMAAAMEIGRFVAKHFVADQNAAGGGLPLQGLGLAERQQELRRRYPYNDPNVTRMLDAGYQFVVLPDASNVAFDFEGDSVRRARIDDDGTGFCVEAGAADLTSRATYDRPFVMRFGASQTSNGGVLFVVNASVEGSYAGELAFPVPHAAGADASRYEVSVSAADVNLTVRGGPSFRAWSNATVPQSRLVSIRGGAPSDAQASSVCVSQWLVRFQVRALENGGENCWSSCGRGGACAMCGTQGACCRVGWDLSLGVCGRGANGCLSSHCCVSAAAGDASGLSFWHVAVPVGSVVVILILSFAGRVCSVRLRAVSRA